MYLTLFVSELPVLAVLTPDQKVYVRAEQTVPDDFRNYPAEKATEYLRSLAEVITEDVCYHLGPRNLKDGSEEGDT